MKPFVAVMALALCGCTQIEVKKLPGGNVEGIPYALPQKTFLVAVEFELQECTFDEANQKVSIAIRKAVSVSSTVGVDPDQRYYIPYDGLNNWMKAVDVTVESHPNQTLKGLTATLEDKTGSIITSALGAVIRVASIASGVGMFDAPKGGDPRKMYCTADALDALDAIKKLKAKQVQAADGGDGQAGEAEADSAVATTTASTQAGGKDEKAKADAKAKEKAAKPAKPAKPKKPAAEPADEATAKIAHLKETLTRKYSVSWTPTSETVNSPPKILPDAVLSAWLTDSGRANFVASKFAIYMEFKPIEAVTPTTKPDKAAGLLVRLPVTGTFRVCEQSCPTDSEVTNVLFVEDHAVPQLGQFVTVPLKSRIFQTQTITLEVAEGGAISKIGYKSNAVADTALSSMNTNLEAVYKAKTAQDKAKADARTKAQSATKDAADGVAAQNKAVSDCLAAQAAVRTAGGTPAGTCQ